VERSLKDRRIVVIGASAGIGRAAAVSLARGGASLVVAARRAAQLEELIGEVGTGVAIPLDLCDPGACAAFGEAAATALGGPVEAVVFTAGTAPLGQVEELDAEQWARTLNTNVVSLNLLVASLLPHLSPRALVAALSSEVVHAPRYGLAAYGASKAALEHSLRSWRIEHPEVRFSTITVGATMPTEFGDAFDPGILTAALEAWAVQGLAQAEFMTTDDVGELLAELVATAVAHPEISMEQVVLRSPAGITSNAEPPMTPTVLRG
jgi:NADP-dependent 3-hydroxy acid dehydrogenase YdfG